jgi:cold shock CspA family protein
VIVVGVVESFDDRRGDGVVLSVEGESFYFHCVSISDGTRHVDQGARVSSVRAVGHRGHDEIVSLQQLSEVSPTR